MAINSMADSDSTAIKSVVEGGIENVIEGDLDSPASNVGSSAAQIAHATTIKLAPVKKLNSIYAKLAIVFSLLVISIGSAVLFLGYQSMRDYYQEITQELNKDIAMYMADSYQLDAKNLVLSRGELTRISERSMVLNPSLEIYLLDNRGVVLDHNQVIEKVVQKQVSLEPIKQFLSNQRRFPLRGSDPKNEQRDKIFSVFTLRNNQQIEGYIYVILGGQLFDDIAANIRSSYVLQTSFYIAILVVLSSLILGLIAFKSITSRLATLTKAMLEFSCERPETVTFKKSCVLNTSSDDEIELLKQSFTKLTSKIEEQFKHLKKADQHRRELISNVSHDLRTPLAITKGYIETLCIKNEDLSSSQRLHYLYIAQRSNEQLATLIDDLFELSKLEAGQIILKCEPFSLLELIYDTVQEFALIAERKNIDIRVPSPTHNIMVNADIALIQRVFANLIANAIKFTPEEGNVSIDFTVENSSIKISVKDTGCGISESDLPHIFERHYFKPKYNAKYSDKSFSATLASESDKLAATQHSIKKPAVNNSFQGQELQQEVAVNEGLGQTALYNSSSGLGLAIVKKILELHNSNIQVTSLAQKGADFQFLLPVMSTKGI